MRRYICMVKAGHAPAHFLARKEYYFNFSDVKGIDTDLNAATRLLNVNPGGRVSRIHARPERGGKRKAAAPGV